MLSAQLSILMWVAAAAWVLPALLWARTEAELIGAVFHLLAGVLWCVSFEGVINRVRRAEDMAHRDKHGVPPYWTDSRKEADHAD